ncbi:hypothetical protein GCM10025865_01350 [Paraoerskovia sediminicola]|uniref:Uncharacterized protein n=1 Tax=Paraoerskovia sediminicola TaxID=1138587 RepID=A0ABM8FYZ6_9CELL|nr:hypothetical protein [Paraoerskovia sediminicola]BDZ40836.1 hypothetical protein GCM10025865_01350 [Paraoerskovia sediminicola]
MRGQWRSVMVAALAGAALGALLLALIVGTLAVAGAHLLTRLIGA